MKRSPPGPTPVGFALAVSLQGKCTRRTSSPADPRRCRPNRHDPRARCALASLPCEMSTRLPTTCCKLNPRIFCPSATGSFEEETNFIRLKDRRVLCALECCDDCIANAHKSLQEIRAAVVDKQVELSDMHDGPLYLLIDAMTLGIRQFLTLPNCASGPAIHRYILASKNSDGPATCGRRILTAWKFFGGTLAAAFGRLRQLPA